MTKHHISENQNFLSPRCESFKKKYLTKKS